MGYITALTFVFLNFVELWEMNRTLFDCGLRKSVELKDGRVYVITSTLEKTVKLSSATVKCKHCDRSFKVQQYLDSHVQFKHPASTTQNSNSISSASRDTSTIFVNINSHSGETNMQRMAESQQLEDVPRESGGVAQGPTQRRSNNRRGSNKRKSYTIDFIKKTLDLLDSLKSSTNKYKTVAKQQGVNRSLVPKWEKNRSKILAELTLTLAELTLTMTKKRQRRRIAGNRSRRTDKYPLTSNPLSAESASRKQSVQTLVKKK